VINGAGAVTDETAARIWEAVEHLGYRPNITARNLRKQSSRLIGYSWKPMAPDQVNPILDKFLTSTVEAAEDAGYHLLLFPHAQWG
jgi:DNA-binding LacI/PurR family transcriptional regulator